MKTKLPPLAILSFLTVAAAHAAPIPVSGNGSYSQNFDTLPTTDSQTWTDDSTIAGWYAQRTGNGTSIVANSGNGTAGALYSYGNGTSTDRALGSLGSGNAAAGNFSWGVQLVNNGTNPLTVNSVSYRGEQWRNSGAGAQTVDFSYQVSATAITSLTPASDTGWTAVDPLDFTSPVTGGAGVALDGNASGNFTNISATVAITLQPGEYAMLRWRDNDHSGSDHGLSIDDLTIGWSEVAPGALSLALAPDTIVETGSSSTSNATVTRSGTPPFASSLTVNITISDPTVATALASVVIPSSTNSANFTITAVDDSFADGDQTATVQVSAAGFTNDSKVITVQDDGDPTALVLNEVFAAPSVATDANGDGTGSNTQDEFVELVNASGALLDISGWTLADGAQVRHTFPAGTVLPVDCAIVVFGGGSPVAFGSALVQTASTGTLGLNNTGDSVTIRDAASNLISSVNFGAPTSDVSFNLNPDLGSGSLVLHNTVPAASGDFSPGRKVDGSDFCILEALTLVINPTSFPESPEGSAATGTVTLPGSAVGPVTVNLASSDGSEATVPATVEIAAGQPSATFDVSAVDDLEPDGNQTVTITASATGFNPDTFDVTVEDDGDVAPPPTLSPGDIAFVAFNADGGDDFAFVALTTIPADTVIHFSDNEWNGGTAGGGGGWVELTEGIISWTAPATPVAAGTVVVLNNISDPLSLTPSIGSATSSLNLNASAETLHAYQGTPVTPTGFLAAIATHTGDSLVGTGLSAEHIIYLPLDVDVAFFTGSRSNQTSFAGYLTPLGDTGTNWTTQDGVGDQSFDSVAPDLPIDATAFTLAASGTDFETWLAPYLAALGGQTGLHDNPDGDGSTNGEEWYFFNSDPSAAGTSGAPLNVTTATGGGSFSFRHSRPVNRSGVSETYQWSTTLDGTWYNSGASNGTITVTLTATPDAPDQNPDPDYESVTVTVATTGTPAPVQLYARLRLDEPPPL